jgi:hypothetical protein
MLPGMIVAAWWTSRRTIMPPRPGWLIMLAILVVQVSGNGSGRAVTRRS